MIYDTLNNCARYYGINKNFEKAFDFIKKAIAENLPVGKYELDGKNLFASVQEYTNKNYEDAKFEGHREYIDIQFIVTGEERMDVVDIQKANKMIDYNPEKDVEFFTDTDLASVSTVTANEYCIFYPNDIHKPGLAVKEKSQVKKVLVKIKI